VAARFWRSAGTARSAQSRRGWGVGSAERGDLIAEDEQLDVFGSRCAAEQQQSAEKSIEDQVGEAYRHVRDHAWPLGDADRRRSRAQAEFWNPAGQGGQECSVGPGRAGWAELAA
jgi:hypothetical protein